MTATSVLQLPLSEDTLAELPSDVSTPGYDRTALRAGIVHFGVGAFHRAHQAVYLDELARTGVTDWGVIGVGLHSREIGEVLAAQNLLYTVVERSADADLVRVNGAMTRYLLAPEDPEAVLAALADQGIRVVSMTITGTGYRIDPHTGGFDADHDDVRADLDSPDRPRTVFGYLVEALDRRRRSGRPLFTVLSCDNMQSNGAAARTAGVSFARLRDAGLADWIEQHVAFPSSMVDRITPTTTPEERDAIAAATGVDDRWPVVTEPFRQWGVEDSFSNGRPPLEQVGVQFLDDVEPYEVMKTRLLNAGHTAIGYLGYLAGYRTTDELMADPVFRAFLTRLMTEEIAPHLPPVPGIDLTEYQVTLVERLSNPRMGDQLTRLGRRGSTKVPNYLLPSVRAALDSGRPHQLLCVAVAGWLRFLRGHDYAGDEMPVQGPRQDLIKVAQDAGTDSSALLSGEEHLRRPRRGRAVRRLRAGRSRGPRPGGPSGGPRALPRPYGADLVGGVDRMTNALDLRSATTLLCDADGTLFPSEEPAYEASAGVTNRYLAHLGAERPYTPRELQQMTNGKNFRGAAAHLADGLGHTVPADLERWIDEEKEVVTAHLRSVLRPDAEVSKSLSRLADRFGLAAVTSSASSRLNACLEVTGLAPFFPPDRRFSAENSLPEPASKPDPAVYVHAGKQLGVSTAQGIALEDSVNGALSAVAAGFPTIGIVVFVPAEDREARTQALLDAGAATVVASWADLADLLL